MYQDKHMDMSGMGYKGEMHHAYDGGKEYPDYGMKMPDMNSCPPPIDCCPVTPGMVCPPVMECPRMCCVHREIIHEVPHIQPITTKIINHHVYRHTLTPTFSCCEENVCSNVYEPPRCGC